MSDRRAARARRHRARSWCDVDGCGLIAVDVAVAGDGARLFFVPVCAGHLRQPGAWCPLCRAGDALHASIGHDSVN